MEATICRGLGRHSCHVVETDFDSMHIESKNELVSSSGTVSNPAEADNKAAR